MTTSHVPVTVKTTAAPNFLATAFAEIESLAASGAHPAIVSILTLLANEIEAAKPQIDAAINTEVDVVAAKIETR